MGYILLGSLVIGGGTVGTIVLYAVWLGKYRRALRAVDKARQAAEDAIAEVGSSIDVLRADIDVLRSPEAVPGPVIVDSEPGEQLRRYIEDV